MLACSWSESHDSVDATLHTKCGHMFRNICTVHVKFTSKKGIFTFTFKLLMHQSLLDQNPTTLIYHRFYHLLTNSFNFHRFRCLCFPVAFPGAKNILQKSGASSKGHVQWHWVPPLEVGIWKGQNPSHVTRCFVVMVMVEPHPSNPRCFKNPRKTNGLFWEKLDFGSQVGAK